MQKERIKGFAGTNSVEGVHKNHVERRGKSGRNIIIRTGTIPYGEP